MCKHLLKSVLLLCAASSAMLGQAPTISNIAISAVSHASFNVQYRLNTSGFAQVRYGLASGTYPYTSVSYSVGQNGSDYNNVDVSLSIGGLAPGTTYYVLPTARPDQDDDNNVCAAPGCGAIEQVVTTLPLPATHPAPPVPPNAWVPVEPNTTSYTVIPMQVSATTGECVAAANVPSQTGWKASVNLGDNITAILGKIFYGTVIEFPQGVSCKVLQTDPYWHTGYMLPALAIDPAAAGSIDSPNHRWIVFRTKTVNPADFPPFGVRTGPQWASLLAKLIVQTPGMSTLQGTTPGPGVQNFNGQIFDCQALQCHHFWFENMEWTHLADQTVYPKGIVDPPAFTDFIRLIPNGSDVLTAATTPDYNVVDRIYAHVQQWPSRQWATFAPGGNHWAIVNSYETARVTSLGLAPPINPSVAGLTVTIPAQAFQMNAFDNTPIGMTGTAAATWTVPAGYAGTFLVWLGNNGLTVDYQTAAGAGVACSGCTTITEATPRFASVPFDHLLVATGHVSGSTVVFDGAGYTTWATVLPQWKPMGIYQFPGNFGYVDNNYFSAPGQTFYNDTDGPHQDETWTHNYVYFPRSAMRNSGQWDGYAYTYRNVFETKQALRWRFEGNIIDGSAAYQNGGNAVYVAGSYAAPFSTGTQDVLIRSNILKHLSSGFQCAGGGAQLPPDSPTASRIEVSNNVWIDLNRNLYNNGGGGLFSGLIAIVPGCEDVNVHNNTGDLMLGSGPALLLMGGASNGTSVQGEGLNFSNNVLHLSLTGLDAMWSQCGQNIASHPAVPANLCSGGSTGTTYLQMLNSTFIHAGLSITPSWTFTHNVVIGAMTNRNQTGTLVDLDQPTLNQIAANFPPGNIFPSGATLAARRAAAKWDPVSFRVTPTRWNAGDVGANINAVQSAAGIVNSIVVLSAPNALQFGYTAPDARACSADVSPNGVSWTRATDSGGSTVRTLLVSGLAPATTYQYRLMCYFDQAAMYEFLSTQITSGTVATSVAAARTVQLAFHRPARAVSVQVTLAPLVGTPITQVCTQSPCVVQASAGSYTRTLQYLATNGSPVGAPDIAILSIR